MSDEAKFDRRVISLGAGVQSSTLYLLALEGRILPKPDYAVFADTQCEPPWVYENLERLREWGGDEIPIRVATQGSLLDAVKGGVNSTGGRFASVPFWVEGQGDEPEIAWQQLEALPMEIDAMPKPEDLVLRDEQPVKEAMGRRQCTREYKIDVVKKAIRTELGLEPGQRAAGRFMVEEWVGISLDEATRAKPSRYPWLVTRWPLLDDVPMNRDACKEYMAGLGFPVPQKSACTFCPFRKPIEYAIWRRDHPELFEEACQVDELIRSKGTMSGMRGQQYVWRALKPLRELPSIETLGGDETAQVSMFDNECEGICGV